MKRLLLGLILLAACKAKPAPPPPDPNAGHVVELKVTKDGFVPTPVTVKAGEPVTLKITRTTEDTCANEIVLKEFGIHTALPLNQEVLVRFTPKQAGELKYGCAMDMMVSGILSVE